MELKDFLMEFRRKEGLLSLGQSTLVDWRVSAPRLSLKWQLPEPRNLRPMNAQRSTEFIHLIHQSAQKIYNFRFMKLFCKACVWFRNESICFFQTQMWPDPISDFWLSDCFFSIHTKGFFSQQVILKEDTHPPRVTSDQISVKKCF